jgi:RecG-like helicase
MQESETLSREQSATTTEAEQPASDAAETPAEKPVARRKQTPRAGQSGAEFKPKAIKPLMVPVGVTHIPSPVMRFDRISLRKHVKYETRFTPITVRGRMMIAEREVRGQRRPIAALRDAEGRNLWIDVAPSEENHGVYIRFFELRHKAVTLLGRVFEKDRVWFIENPEPIPQRWVNSSRPIYELHVKTQESLVRHAPNMITDTYLCDAKVQNDYRRSVMHDESFRKYLSASVKELQHHALKDRECMYVALGVLSMANSREAIVSALTSVHRPTNHSDYDTGMDKVRRIAAVAVIYEQVKEGLRQRRERLERAEGLTAPHLPQWVADDPDKAVTTYSQHLPFPLTDEQRAAAAQILCDLASGAPMRRVLSGDVGSGKTGVFAVPIAAMIDAGFRVAVILPSTLLAVQLHEKMLEFVPDARHTLVAGAGAKPDQDANLWVGTVGVQYQSERTFDLCVIDEQQRFSRAQREWQTAEKDHLLEVTATCIPRTQALMDSAVLDVSRLKSCHVAKKLRTRIWEPDTRARLVHHVSEDVQAGFKVMVVYPGKNASDENAPMRVAAVNEFRDVWERQFPGRVAVCHGGQTDEENDAAVASVRSGEKAVLLATSIIEVGIDIMGVRRMIVVQPERFGLSTLHQLRGRVAREGGEGWCELVLTGDITERARARLTFLARHTDGFALSEYDLEDRGAGDAVADGHKQSGKLPKSPFDGYQPPQDLVSKIASELAEVYRFGVPEQAATYDDRNISNENAAGHVA